MYARFFCSATSERKGGEGSYGLISTNDLIAMSYRGLSEEIIHGSDRLVAGRKWGRGEYYSCFEYAGTWLRARYRQLTGS